MSAAAGMADGPPTVTAPEGPGPAPVTAATRGRRLRHPIRWIAGALLVALAAVGIVAATRPSYQATQVQSPLVGHRAPTLAGAALSGRRFSLGAERGHYVYVNFFASWCPPCQREEQTLVDFAFRQQRLSAGARMVSVVFNDTVSDARRFDAQWGIEWPVVPDRGGAIANRYGVESPPMTFLVDPAGTVVGTWVGPVTVAQLDEMLRAARGGELFSGGTGNTNG